MDNRTFVLSASILLSTLRNENAPSGILYTAFSVQGMTFEQYNDLLGMLTGKGLIKQSNNVLSLTVKGKELAEKIDSVMGI